MSLVIQRHTASLRRRDGHTIDGTPGDCLRACVASLAGHRYQDVWHYAQHVHWWEAMRRQARLWGNDWACLPAASWADGVTYIHPGALLIGNGPSLRGPWWHSVLVDQALQLVHDPYPSGTGLLSVQEVFVYCNPYNPAPYQLALPAKRRAPKQLSMWDEDDA